MKKVKKKHGRRKKFVLYKVLISEENYDGIERRSSILNSLQVEKLERR